MMILMILTNGIMALTAAMPVNHPNLTIIRKNADGLHVLNFRSKISELRNVAETIKVAVMIGISESWLGESVTHRQ